MNNNAFFSSSRDISEHEEYSFYDQCLTNLEADIKSSEALPWANLADLGDGITEFSINVSIRMVQLLGFSVYYIISVSCLFNNGNTFRSS